MEQPVVYLAWRHGAFSCLLILSFSFLSYDVSCDMTKWQSIMVIISGIISQTALKLPLNAPFHHSRLQNPQDRKPHFLFVYILITDLEPTFTKGNPVSRAKLTFHFLSSVTYLTLTESLQ